MADANNPPPAAGEEGRSFTQADVDRIVADRLAREKGKYADYEELKAKATKLDEQEAASKTETEKAAAALAKAEERAAAAEARALRLEIAAERGLTPTQAKRLVGSTREELEADAAEILEAFPVQGGATPPPSNKPATDLRGGTEPNDDPVETDPAKLAASVPRVN